MSASWRSLYVKNANVYQPILEYGLATAPAEARGLAKIFRKQNISNSSRILDVSCGIGRHSVQLAKLGYEVVGFDFSAYFLNTARRLAKKERLGHDRLRLCQGDTESIEKVLGEKGESKFDAIICMDGGLHRPTKAEENKLLRAMRRLSRNGGILAIDMYSREFMEEYFFKLYNKNWLLQYFSKAKLERHMLMDYNR